MQPRDLHRPKEASPCASCLQGSCLVFVLGLVYVALRAQPSEGASVVYQKVPPLKPVSRQPVLAPSSLEQPEARPPKNWLPHRPATRERADAEPYRQAPPVVEPQAEPKLPELQPAATSAPVPAAPRRRVGDGDGSGRASSVPSPPAIVAADGVRLLSPSRYLEHLSYMERHPPTARAASATG